MVSNNPVIINGFKRGVYLAMMYENGPEFLRSEIEEKRFEDEKEI